MKTTNTLRTCDYCRKIHRRCDSQLPTCGRCKSLGLTCVYSERKRRRTKEFNSKTIPNLLAKKSSTKDITTSIKYAMALEEAKQTALMWEQKYKETAEQLQVMTNLYQREVQNRCRKRKKTTIGVLSDQRLYFTAVLYNYYESTYHCTNMLLPEKVG